MTRPTPAAVLAQPRPITVGGDTYIIRPASEWMNDAQAALAAHRPAEASRIVLGDEQYAAFRTTAPTVSTFAELFAAIGDAFGAIVVQVAAPARGRVRRPKRGRR